MLLVAVVVAVVGSAWVIIGVVIAVVVVGVAMVEVEGAMVFRDR